MAEDSEERALGLASLEAEVAGLHVEASNNLQ